MTDQVEAQAPGLSLNDIANAVSVIDTATSRGAWRGEELTPVGALRDRFVAFLKVAEEAQAADVAQAAEVSGAEATAEDDGA
jgi:hypothetical protein